MGPQREDLTGQRFGRLVVTEKAPRRDDTAHPLAYWVCRCDCGKERIARHDFLKNGSVHSCTDCPHITDEGEYMKYTAFNGNYFLFDKEDLPAVQAHRWNVDNDGRVTSHRGKQSLLIFPNIVMKVDAQTEGTVAHMNGDSRDNRKVNLQVLVRPLRDARRKLYRNNTSGYKGVCSLRKAGVYTAQIGYHGKLVYLGRFSSAAEAAVAYDAAAIEFFGEFAVTNEELLRRKEKASAT